MTQKRYHTWQRPLDSSDENERFVGILQPGRFRGFDVFTNVGLDFQVGHGAQGIIKTNSDASISPSTGVYLTPQGVIVNEDETLTGLSVDSNLGNPVDRIDLLVATHQYAETGGGAAATYIVIKGATGSTTTPILPNPEIQTLIGTILIPAEAINLDGAVYTPSRVVGIGNINRFELDQYNTMTGTFNNAGQMEYSAQSGEVESDNTLPLIDAEKSHVTVLNPSGYELAFIDLASSNNTEILYLRFEHDTIINPRLAGSNLLPNSFPVVVKAQETLELKKVGSSWLMPNGNRELYEPWQELPFSALVSLSSDYTPLNDNFIFRYKKIGSTVHVEYNIKIRCNVPDLVVVGMGINSNAKLSAQDFHSAMSYTINFDIANPIPMFITLITAGIWSFARTDTNAWANGGEPTFSGSITYSLLPEHV